MEQELFVAAATSIAAVAVFTDTKYGLVPNQLTFSAILGGVTAHGVAGGPEGLLFALQGAALGLGLFLLPFLWGAMGAGDVKLLAGLGALVGPALVFGTFAFSTMLGGVIAFVILARELGWQLTLVNVTSGWGALLSMAQPDGAPHRFPFASAIFFGLFFSLASGLLA